MSDLRAALGSLLLIAEDLGGCFLAEKIVTPYFPSFTPQMEKDRRKMEECLGQKVEEFWQLLRGKLKDESANGAG